MKYFLFCLLLLTSLPACKDESFRFSNAEIDESIPLVGKWQLVEASFSIGTAEQHWQRVENGYILNLKRDGSFETNKPDTSSGGTYNFKDDNLILEYAGNIEPSQYTYRYSVSGDTLLLDPLSPTMCFEGCTSKLLRIK